MRPDNAREHVQLWIARAVDVDAVKEAIDGVAEAPYETKEALGRGVDSFSSAAPDAKHLQLQKATQSSDPVESCPQQKQLPIEKLFQDKEL